MLIASILKSLLFGFTIALAIGPIALLIVNYGVTRGFASAVRSGLGAGLADLTYATIAFVAGDLLVARLETHRAQFELSAALVLIGFGVYMLYAALRPRRMASSAESSKRGGELATTYVLTLLNPMTIVAFAGFAGQLPLAGSAARAILLAVAVFAGSVVVQFALGLAGAHLGRWLATPAALRALNVASGLGVMLFGLIGLWPHVAAT
jgi:arginine exporter protein ArgO